MRSSPIVRKLARDMKREKHGCCFCAPVCSVTLFFSSHHFGSMPNYYFSARVHQCLSVNILSYTIYDVINFVRNNNCDCHTEMARRRFPEIDNVNKIK